MTNSPSHVASGPWSSSLPISTRIKLSERNIHYHACEKTLRPPWFSNVPSALRIPIWKPRTTASSTPNHRDTRERLTPSAFGYENPWRPMGHDRYSCKTHASARPVPSCETPGRHDPVLGNSPHAFGAWRRITRIRRDSPHVRFGTLPPARDGSLSGHVLAVAEATRPGSGDGETSRPHPGGVSDAFETIITTTEGCPRMLQARRGIQPARVSRVSEREGPLSSQTTSTASVAQ